MLGEIRIIAGRWRGRKIKFPNLSEIRPTPNRVRETLFNWLQMEIVESICLDLFSGSGALGFEALSRYAKYCVMCDSSNEVINYLRKQVINLKLTEQVQILKAKIPEENIHFSQKFNIIFLDPPYHQGLIKSTSEWLEKMNVFAPKTYIYIEAEASLTELSLPPSWKIIKSKIAGEVGYHLCLRSS